MKFEFRRKLVCAVALSALVPLSGHAADEVVPNVAFLSLIGDKLNTEVFKHNVGSNMDPNRRMVMPITSPVFDAEAVQAANTAFKKLRPGVKTTLLVTQDPGLYAAQNNLFDAADDNKDNRTYLGSLLKNRAVTQLVVITKQRGYAEFRVENGAVGGGRIEGLGYYLDNETGLRNSRSLATGTGFVAAYVYAKVRLVDAETLNVLKEVTVKGSDLNLNYDITNAEQAAWNALTSEQKVARMNEVINGSMNEAVTNLLIKP